MPIWATIILHGFVDKVLMHFYTQNQKMSHYRLLHQYTLHIYRFSSFLLLDTCVHNNGFILHRLHCRFIWKWVVDDEHLKRLHRWTKFDVYARMAINSFVYNCNWFCILNDRYIFTLRKAWNKSRRMSARISTEESTHATETRLLCAFDDKNPFCSKIIYLLFRIHRHWLCCFSNRTSQCKHFINCQHINHNMQYP